MYINKTSFKVRYVETDKMGIVHHSNYYPWFEIGRGEFIKETDISYKDMEEQGILMPLAESYCKYIIPAKYEDLVTIETWIETLSPVKVIFNYKVIREEDEVILAKGSTTHAFVNSDFKIINIKKLNNTIWDKINELK
ncbi:acyl-CoA thioesterase [Clostridium intestinale]|jgi:acyl-CoA thioester hydrolase|uniref:Acyl-CoA thioesterase n=1 Tax=Clostridium intestinale TaxID=36845 RepID=A0A7D7A507_9CLOT|nr:thioesterase family protein [Clostridium intestinale]QLY80780.1 acyl-CoA thioesterase [Clostridium intestinale]